MDSDRGDGGGSGALEKLSTKLAGFISEARSIKSDQLLLSIAQLCYSDTQLAYDVWVESFPKLWSTLSDRQRSVSTSYICIHLLTHIIYYIWKSSLARQATPSFFNVALFLCTTLKKLGVAWRARLWKSRLEQYCFSTHFWLFFMTGFVR